MIVFEITKDNGEKRTFSFEQDLNEMRLSRFVQFKETVETTKPESLSEYETAEDNDKPELLKTYSPEQFNQWLDYYLKFAMYWAGIPEDVAAELREEEIAFLYLVINKAIAGFEYREGEKSFKFKEEEYFYPPQPLNPFHSKHEPMKGVRVIDTITALQFELFAGQLGKSNWSALPNIIAILCKKKDEEMPLDSVQRDQWISQRAKLFGDLPMSVALQAAFFFASPRTFSEFGSSHSLIREAKEEAIKRRLRFGRSTDGIAYLNRLPKAASLIART